GLPPNKPAPHKRTLCFARSSSNPRRTRRCCRCESDRDDNERPVESCRSPAYCCFENRLNRNSSLNEMKMFTTPSPLTAPRKYELSHNSRVIGIQLAKKLLSQYSDHGKTSSTTPTSRQNTMNRSADALWYQR